MNAVSLLLLLGVSIAVAVEPHRLHSIRFYYDTACFNLQRTVEIRCGLLLAALL